MQYPPAPEGRAAAFLGVDLDRDADGRWVIARVLPGESSVPAARSPLRAAGADVRAGDVLVAVNGHLVGAAGPAPLLAGLAGKPVALTVSRAGAARTVAVVPTADEAPIRYQDWVSGRREATHAASEGRVGYVHVPDMMSTGWAEFNRDLRREMRRDALIVDTRDNGGGHVSELVIEQLARRPLGGGHARHYADEPWPTTAPRGPLVSLANEFAGSDGDIVNETFHELGLGTIVGVRTWGGVIGIDGRYSLVDGTEVTQPRTSFWFRDAGWTVENFGVEPDIEVPFPPQAWVAGTDPQLDAGVQVLVGALASTTPLSGPSMSSRPDRAAPALPPRP
jgi:tricorn protease